MKKYAGYCGKLSPFFPSFHHIFYVLIVIIFSVSTNLFADIIDGIPTHKQEKSQWCWAAVCQSLLEYYYPEINKTQTEIASVLTTRNEAVDPDRLVECLEVNGEPVDLQAEMIVGTLTWPEMKKEADEKRPFYFLIRWNSGGYHSNVFAGYIEDSTRLRFMDPGRGSFVDRSYEDCFNVSGRGTWERTYLISYGPSRNKHSSASPRCADTFKIVSHTSFPYADAITFMFNTNGSKMLRIYNPLGICVYESAINRTMTQVSWSVLPAFPSGLYTASLGVEKSNGTTITSNKTFYIVK